MLGPGTLFAEGMQAGGDVFLGDGFTAAGAVRLPGAVIAGQLNCNGAELAGRPAPRRLRPRIPAPTSTGYRLAGAGQLGSVVPQYPASEGALHRSLDRPRPL